MKKIFLCSITLFLGLLIFSPTASAKTIDIDTSQVPASENLTVDNEFIDVDSLLIEMDNQTFCVVDNKLVPTINRFGELNTSSARGSYNWSAGLGNGGSNSRNASTVNGQRVSYGSQPASGGTATRNMRIWSGGTVYLDSTSNTGRWQYSFNSKGGSLTFRTTNYSSFQNFNFWLTL